MRLVISAILVVALLAGCSGGDANEGSSTGTDQGSAFTDFIPGAVDFRNEADATQHYLQKEREAQDQIAACMADQGFEYVPHVLNQDQGGYAAPDTQEEFVSLYGFGIATMMLENLRPDEAEYEAEMAKDPNHAIVEAMSDEERDAYYEALYGARQEYDFGESSGTTTPSTDVSLEVNGCQGVAYDRIWTDGSEMEFYEQFGPMMEDLYTNLESDARIAEMEGEWSSCMAEAGYDFAEETDAQIFLLRRLEEVGAVTDLDVDSEGNGWSYGSDYIEPGSPMEAAVKEIAAEELAMAQVSLGCASDRESVIEEVYRDAEQRFITEHLAELQQFKEDHS